MIVFRLSKSESSTNLSGKGAEKAGGRWNSKGIAMVYSSDSRALCTTEIAVHTPLGNIPVDYTLITIEIPDDSILEINPSSLPDDWKSLPPVHATQNLGDSLVVEGKFLVLKVPSAVIQGDFNFLLNPNHPDFTKMKILSVEPYTFDERLFK
jgi:RES domain-containing protein